MEWIPRGSASWGKWMMSEARVERERPDHDGRCARLNPNSSLSTGA
jgi:hypothetical protein